jgi:hypothetical protein
MKPYSKAPGCRSTKVNYGKNLIYSKSTLQDTYCNPSQTNLLLANSASKTDLTAEANSSLADSTIHPGINVSLNPLKATTLA